jgi:thioredoxin-related protein
MQSAISAINPDYPLLTVALHSGDDAEVNAYLQSKQLSWQAINDQQGLIANAYGVSAVPAVFFTDSNGKIVFTTTGYTSELGLRLRLWLAAWL